MRKFVLLLVVFLLSFIPFMKAQDRTVGLQEAPTHTELSHILKSFFSAYKVNGYRPSQTMGADSFSIDTLRQVITIYVNEAFSGQPLTMQTVADARNEILLALPSPYNTYDISFITSQRKTELETLVPNYKRSSEKDLSRLWRNTTYRGKPWVQNVSLPYSVSKGLSGRHIMLWPSHGRYWLQTRWEWQRPYLFCTTEDLFTQSFVNPFLLPMLEKAGAVAYSARERDYQTAEAIVDNDSPERDGHYEELNAAKQVWIAVDSIPAFARPDGLLTDSVQPFRLGTARQIATTSSADTATATWTPNIPRTGQYAVYVSYQTLPQSVDDAHYTVYHKGGVTCFSVNQQMGGGTWVYLGTFPFEAGENSSGRVVLSNRSTHTGLVTADAVRFGGGMGQTIRGTVGTSGLPRFLEAARYQAQWCGLPDSLYHVFTNDEYKDDIRSRSNLLNYLGGGSIYMPTDAGLKVPFEVSFAFHSDAGVHRDNQPFGSLSICTTIDNDKHTTYPSGISRMASSDFSAMLLDNVRSDLSRTFRIAWPLREHWDRNYGETRSPHVPSAILESMSHQNFRDVQLGHDPLFKFTLARAVYKCLLRFVNLQHGISDYVVAPLPVHNFAAILSPVGATVSLSWSPTKDSLEASASPTHYILYTKAGNREFDNGRDIGNVTSCTFSIEPDVQYSFRVTAANEGGESFPSETLSVYKALKPKGDILIVNGFERLCGPAVVDTPDSLGFDLHEDVGVPYLSTAAFAGYQTCFDRTKLGKSGAGALGYGDNTLQGSIIAGNTFDYPVIHGKSIANLGKYSFSSCSKESAVSLPWNNYIVVDYIAGLEKDAPYNLRHYKTFDVAIQEKMRAYTRQGGNILVSGAFIASDMQDTLERAFTADVLKYAADSVERSSYDLIDGLKLSIPIQRQFSPSQYAVQVSDGLQPTDERAFAAFAYASGRPAGIAYKGSDYRVVAMGFPFESINDETVRNKAMAALLRFLAVKN